MLPAKKILHCLLTFIFCIQAVFGQYKLEQRVHIGKEQGLPSNDIRSIRKGPDGFMWLGTADGLCRFDGHQVKVFQEGDDLQHALFDNTVNTVLPVKDKVWMGTSQGLSILNTHDYTFTHYQLNDSGKINTSLVRKYDQGIGVLYPGKKGKIWIGTRSRGVCLYDGAKDNFRFYSFSRKEYPPLMPSLAGDNTILSIEESETNDSVLWAGTGAGLQEINKYTGHVKLITFPQKSRVYQIALNAFRRLYHHDDGLLYAGSWAAGVNIYDPVAGTFVPLPVKNSDGKKMLNNPIENIFRKSSHEIWINTGAGLAIYDSELKDIKWCKFNDGIKNEFYAIDYIDDANRVWYGDINGLHYFDPAMQQFSRYSFKHLTNVDWGYAFFILSDKTGNQITVCPRLTDGIFHFDKQKSEWTKSTFPKDKTFATEKDVVRGFVRLPSGEYIISADRGVFLYSEKRKRMSEIHNGLPFSPTRRGDLLLDHAGNLWFSDDSKGLVKWRPGTTTYRIYNNSLATGETKTFFNRLVNLYEDSHGNIWFQRIGGFAVYLAERDSIISFIYKEKEENSFPITHSFAEDKMGRVWISGGENQLGYALSNNPARGVIYKINLKDRDIRGYFERLAVNAHGEIWGYNLKELVKINGDDLSFTRYSFLYGVNEADFYHFSFLPSGEMIFGGRNDITIANSSGLKRNTELPVPYIVEMQVLNHPFDLKMDGSPQCLTHKQNFFSIGFSAQAYTMAKEVRFRYRLKEFDDWTEATGRRFANYTNVPGGDYVFELQAANNEGIWNNQMLALPVHIATPWWHTGWFRGAAIILIATLIWWTYRYRISQVKKKEKLKTQYEKKLANVEMTALLAQMNPHFLFNSLNSIDSYIIRNESKKASEYLNNFARLMRLILQNSRSNYISLKDELETLDLYMQMEGLRFKDKFQYEITVDKEVDTSSIVIPPMLIQPYVENAIWHGLMHKHDETPGKVEIFIHKQDDNLYCVVQDNGIGREKAQELKAHKSGNHKRSMGMQITMERIDMINKLYNTNTSLKITDLKDGEGKATGTKVELIVPV